MTHGRSHGRTHTHQVRKKASTKSSSLQVAFGKSNCSSEMHVRVIKVKLKSYKYCNNISAWRNFIHCKFIWYRAIKYVIPISLKYYLIKIINRNRDTCKWDTLPQINHHHWLADTEITSLYVPNIHNIIDWSLQTTKALWKYYRWRTQLHV